MAFEIIASNVIKSKLGYSMYKKSILFLSLTLALFSFDKNVPNGKIMGTSSCPICNMYIKKFYKTSHAVVYNNGKKEHFCSITCLVKEMKKRKDIKMIYAVDASTNKLINAKKAIYVIGSKISSTMGKTSRFAFASKSSAKAFQKRYGGKIGNFSEALNVK